MSTVILDECLQNLFYAQEAMKEWIPMTDYEVIFEASENPETAEKVAKNSETAEKSVGFIRKAIDAVIALIKRIAESIGDFINRCTMKGDERTAFEEFKATMAKDPTMKNKKVTVKDFRKINDGYDKLVDELDKTIRAVKTNPSHSIDNISSKVTDFLKGAASATSAIVAADVAVKMADSNVHIAKMLKFALTQEEDIMESLSKSLGKKNAEKFQKDIDAAAKNTRLHQLKVKLFRHKYNNLQECISGTIAALTHAGFRSVGDIKQEIQELKEDLKSGKISKDVYKKRLDELNKDKSKAKKERLSSLSMDKKLVDNEYTGTIIKTTAKAAVKGAVDAKKDDIKTKTKTFIQDHITDRDRKKRDGKGEYKSAIDFVVGK